MFCIVALLQRISLSDFLFASRKPKKKNASVVNTRKWDVLFSHLAHSELSSISAHSYVHTTHTCGLISSLWQNEKNNILKYFTYTCSNGTHTHGHVLKQFETGQFLFSPSVASFIIYVCRYTVATSTLRARHCSELHFFPCIVRKKNSHFFMLFQDVENVLLKDLHGIIFVAHNIEHKMHADGIVVVNINIHASN